MFESPDPKRLAVCPRPASILAPGLRADGGHRESDPAVRARSRLAPYQKIRVLEFCELPKTVSGKVKRNELRATEATRSAAGVRGEHEYPEADFPELLDSARRA